MLKGDIDPQVQASILRLHRNYRHPGRGGRVSCKDPFPPGAASCGSSASPPPFLKSGDLLQSGAVLWNAWGQLLFARKAPAKQG